MHRSRPQNALFLSLFMFYLFACTSGDHAGTEPLDQKAGQPPLPAAISGDVWTDPISDMVFVWIPEGCFQMGQSAHEKEQLLRSSSSSIYARNYQNELPQHEVCLSKGFWLGRYEVTNAQYRRYKSIHDIKKYKGGLNGDDQPAAGVSWNDATVYAKWLSSKGNGRFRLPTEAEWEYAARAGTTTIYYWGDGSDQACTYANVQDLRGTHLALRDVAHNCDDGFPLTAPVGSFRPNAFGLYDMLGNISEWCQDGYGDYPATKIRDPHGPQQATRRVARGGDWFSGGPRRVRCASRYHEEPNVRSHIYGFRLVRE